MTIGVVMLQKNQTRDEKKRERRHGSRRSRVGLHLLLCLEFLHNVEELIIHLWFVFKLRLDLKGEVRNGGNKNYQLNSGAAIVT